MLTRTQIEAMREWTIECAVDSDDQIERENADDREIVRYVSRHYSGGLAEFFRCHDAA